MTITLDTATEQRLKRELDRGRFADANQLIAHAIGLIEAEEAEQVSDSDMKDWLSRNRDAIKDRLVESFAAKARDESYSSEEAKAVLAERRAARTHHAAWVIGSSRLRSTI